jgi:NDP-sugar pyrophosphorylase family protein
MIEDNYKKREGNLKTPKWFVKIGGEYLIERIIRIGRSNGIKKIYCIINDNEYGLKKYLSATDYGITITFIAKTAKVPIHRLLLLLPVFMTEGFCLITPDIIFNEREFADFVSYSMRQDEDVDGVFAVTRYVDDESPICITMNEEDTILKFIDSKEGYNWKVGGIFYFSQKNFKEFKNPSGVENLKFSDFLRSLLVTGYLFKGYSFSKIIDINCLSDINEANTVLREIE